ncbi:MAG: winged helix-turn-helix transcriptional regulator [Chitinophagaceae bacterium]|nr:winged helix-turn-helix transcriptional regulator [Chitinophagaceae bacterium]
MRRDVFQAIADPTRRAIISMVAKQSMNLNAVAENFEVSRPAISKHIRILTECGLITIKQQGRERYCEAKLQKLNEVSDWVEQYRQFWEKKLDALESYLSELQSSGKSTAKKNAKRKQK